MALTGAGDVFLALPVISLPLLSLLPFFLSPALFLSLLSLSLSPTLVVSPSRSRSPLLALSPALTLSHYSLFSPPSLFVSPMHPSFSLILTSSLPLSAASKDVIKSEPRASENSWASRSRSATLASSGGKESFPSSRRRWRAQLSN